MPILSKSVLALPAGALIGSRINEPDTIDTLRQEIATIKAELAEITDMRPGSISEQRHSATSDKRYLQLNYSFQGRSRSEYLPRRYAEEAQREIDAYRRFRALCERWIELSLALSKLKMKRK
jgi:hypothetical protein